MCYARIIFKSSYGKRGIENSSALFGVSSDLQIFTNSDNYLSPQILSAVNEGGFISESTRFALQ
jgi:hypothetical protein